MLEDPWLVAEKGFPKKGTAREKMLFLLNYAILAPSGHNTQPWLFEVTDDAVALYADRTQALPVIDPGDRELVMSCGAALFNLLTAIRHFYLTPIVDTFPDKNDPDLLARVQLGDPEPDTPEAVHNLFRAIKKRRTNRLPFKRRPIPENDLAAFHQVAEAGGVGIKIITDLEEKQSLAALIAEGDKRQGANKHFRRELASWIHPSRSKRKEGLPGYALGAGDVESMVVPFLVRTFDWGNGQAARNMQLAEGSPALTVLYTAGDAEKDWLKMGQTLAHLLLMGTHFGVYASYLNQPLEVPELRAQVVKTLDITGYPQLILRMGFGPTPDATPRKPLREVLKTTG